MGPLTKFGIASGLIIAVLSWWPLHQWEQWSIHGGSEHSLLESSFLTEARLVDEFVLNENPAGKGRASQPKAWESALDAQIFLRESWGEAVGEIGGIGDIATISEPVSGKGVLIENKKGTHFIIHSTNERGWYLVLSRDSNTPPTVQHGISESKPPTSISMALAVGIIGGLLITLLAKVALRPPDTSVK